MEFHKILVPVVGSEVDVETIKLACRLARKEKAKILALHVIPIERSLPLDAELAGEVRKAENILTQAEKTALAQGCEIETDLLQARNAGPSIVDEAVEREIDLIVMGLTYKRQFGQFSMGNVTPYVLKNAPCPVILYQQSQPE
ncbi:MAG: universal stress protein [Dehalococcoidales bacterium]|nr:universal stress protein [Dehalococcoidales bacterium]